MNINKQLDLVLSNCGANQTGGGGFTQGNTCASGSSGSKSKKKNYGKKKFRGKKSFEKRQQEFEDSLRSDETEYSDEKRDDLGGYSELDLDDAKNMHIYDLAKGMMKDDGMTDDEAYTKANAIADDMSTRDLIREADYQKTQIKKPRKKADLGGYTERELRNARGAHMRDLARGIIKDEGLEKQDAVNKAERIVDDMSTRDLIREADYQKSKKADVKENELATKLLKNSANAKDVSDMVESDRKKRGAPSHIGSAKKLGKKEIIANRSRLLKKLGAASSKGPLPDLNYGSPMVKEAQKKQDEINRSQELRDKVNVKKNRRNRGGK